MDEDYVALILFISLFLTFPFVLITGILSCIACSRTRAWKKEQRKRRFQNLSQSPDNESLVESEEEEEDDFLDTEDEEDQKKAKAEELADRNLTTRQKFRKEFGRAWKGNVQDLQKQKEREERRKLAKAVAREIERQERRARRQERRAGAGSSADGDLLPRYEATVGDRKQAGGQ